MRGWHCDKMGKFELPMVLILLVASRGQKGEILGIKGDAKITTALFMVAKLSKDMISFLS